MPASISAQKADGVLLCEFNSHIHYQHTLTVWKKQMLAYRSSPSQLRAMKRILQIGTGKVYAYETDTIPSWEAALAEWDNHGRKILF